MDLSLLTPQKKSSASPNTTSFRSHYHNEHPAKRHCDRGASLGPLTLDGTEHTLPTQFVLEGDFFALPDDTSNVAWQDGSFLDSYNPILQATDSALYASEPWSSQDVSTHGSDAATQLETLDWSQTEIMGTEVCFGMACGLWETCMSVQAC